jgi:hypothetical protein
MEIKAFNIEQDHIEIKGEILKGLWDWHYQVGIYIRTKGKGVRRGISQIYCTRYAIGVGSGTDALRHWRACSWSETSAIR